jgi:ribonuclease HI
MQAASPHFLLFTEASATTGVSPRWRFVLQPLGGDKFLAADDVEPGTSENRLELLAVVRGLEALDEPSRVTLLTASRYVNRGIRRGLSQWRERKWRWERFGQLVPIRNQDLWQRVDRAMQFHQLECCPAQLAEDSREVARGEVTAFKSNIPAAEAASPVESALLVVPRRNSERTVLDAGQPGRFLSTLNRLRQRVLAPLAAIWRPAFTRAA